MADITEQTATVKAIAANIDAGYMALQKAAGNITGLLKVGKATCLDIQAYNAFARAVYYAQVAMVQRAQAAGDATNLPSVISYPTYFPYKGQINFACPSASGLQGMLAAAMAPPTPATVYLSLDDVQVINGQKPNVQGAMPSYAELTRAQGQLGLPVLVWLLIAGAAVYLGSRAISALFDYFAEAKIQEQTTARNAQLLEGYATQTKARLDCYQQCMTRAGNSDAGCTDVCAKLITKPPELATGSQRATTGLGFLGTVGLVAVAAVGGYLAFKFVRKDHVARAYDVAAEEA